MTAVAPSRIFDVGPDTTVHVSWLGGICPTIRPIPLQASKRWAADDAAAPSRF
jgi:hypothetical protein